MAGKGSIILVMGFSVIMGYMITILTSLGSGAMENMSWYNSATASKNLATIGTNAGLAWLRENPSDRNEIMRQNITSGSYRGGLFYVNVDDVGLANVRVRTISEFPVSSFNTIRDTVDVFLHPAGESDYQMFAWIANVSGNAQFFYSDDIVWGPIHSNGGIHLGNIPHNRDVPIFHGPVTSSQNIQPAGSDRARFLGGYHTGTNRIDIPDQFHSLISAASTGSGKIYDKDLYIKLQGDEVAVWYSSTEVTNAAIPPDESFRLDEMNGAIYTTKNVRIKGTLDGKVDIGAGGDVIIVGNILYATDPPYELADPPPDPVDGIERQKFIGLGTDLLGLYAGNDIVIADKNSRDFEVHGILLALNELRAENYKNRPLVTLDTWGSIIMHNRGEVRHQNNGVIQRYRYDTRLEDNTFRPNYFPDMVTTSFQITSWYESIQFPPF